MTSLTRAGVDSALAVANEAVDLAQADAQRARERALEALRLARVERDPEAASVAERALGLAAREASDLVTATVHLRRAVRIAERASLTQRAGQARMSLSLVLLYRGTTAAALRESDRAGLELTGPESARLRMQRALILQRLGRHDEALWNFRHALAAFQAAGDRIWESRLLTNRGVLHAYRGDTRAAEADLRMAEGIYAELGQAIACAQVHHNLGFVAARRGDVPAALAWYDQAEEELRELGIPTWISWLDRCELLLSVSLTHEARAAASEAVSQLEARAMVSDLAEARLMLSHASLRAGEPAEALRLARQAERAFARQERTAWAALAGHAALRARWDAGSRSPALLESASAAAAALADAGWAAAALDARIVAARVALHLGRHERAQRELGLARRARHRGTQELRVRAWHAEALARLASGDRRGALAALSAGMGVVDRQRGRLGSTELRALAASHSVELAALGVQLALGSGDARRVLVWEERRRAGALRMQPGRPPDDPAFADALAGLRAAAAAVDEAIAGGGDVAAAKRRLVTLEQGVRARARQALAAADVVAGIPGPRGLAAMLGERALVEYLVLGGELHAVVVAGGRTCLRGLGEVAPVERELHALRFAMRRLAHEGADEASREAFSAALRHASMQLDAALLAPLARLLADRELVLAPTGALHALPWAVLPSCAGRAVSAVPSAVAWQRAASAPRAAWGGSATLLVSGPGLPHGAREVADLATSYSGASLLTGAIATASGTLAALGAAQSAHLACHGTFRADNPLFSALQLADGPLMVYDLERLESVPREIVLSACDSALSAVHAGDEIMGLMAALLTLGASTLIGSVVPVRDDVTRVLMGHLHDGLRAGVAPAHALAGAQARVGDDAAAFVCFGRG